MHREQQINDLLRNGKIYTKVNNPPNEYLVVDENNGINKTIKQLQENSFYKPPDTDDDMITIAAQLNKNRKHYLKEMEKHAREQVISSLVRKQKESIKISVENSDKRSELFDLMKQKHKWRSQYIKLDHHLPKICKIETCPNICVDESDYCINHIMNDPSNKLFIKCPNCDRVHLINMPCLICGKQ